jgi:hypothetical protein
MPSLSVAGIQIGVTDGRCTLATTRDAYCTVIEMPFKHALWGEPQFALCATPITEEFLQVPLPRLCHRWLMAHSAHELDALNEVLRGLPQEHRLTAVIRDAGFIMLARVIRGEPVRETEVLASVLCSSSTLLRVFATLFAHCGTLLDGTNVIGETAVEFRARCLEADLQLSWIDVVSKETSECAFQIAAAYLRCEVSLRDGVDPETLSKWTGLSQDECNGAITALVNCGFVQRLEEDFPTPRDVDAAERMRRQRLADPDLNANPRWLRQSAMIEIVAEIEVRRVDQRRDFERVGREIIADPEADIREIAERAVVSVPRCERYRAILANPEYCLAQAGVNEADWCSMLNGALAIDASVVLRREMQLREDLRLQGDPRWVAVSSMIDGLNLSRGVADSTRAVARQSLADRLREEHAEGWQLALWSGYCDATYWERRRELLRLLPEVFRDATDDGPIAEAERHLAAARAARPAVWVRETEKIKRRIKARRSRAGSHLEAVALHYLAFCILEEGVVVTGPMLAFYVGIGAESCRVSLLEVETWKLKVR